MKNKIVLKEEIVVELFGINKSKIHFLSLANIRIFQTVMMAL